MEPTENRILNRLMSLGDKGINKIIAKYVEVRSYREGALKRIDEICRTGVDLDQLPNIKINIFDADDQCTIILSVLIELYKAYCTTRA